MKTCTRCNTTKPLTDFHRERGGHKARCKTCVNEVRREGRPKRPHRQRRFPFEPIEKHLRRTLQAGIRPPGGGTDPSGVSVVQMAEHLGCSSWSLHTWRRRGINEQRADKLAIQLGHHPLEFWPDYYTEEDAA